MDKPNNFKETLADLPEVKAICRPSLSFLEGECSLYGLKRLGLGGYQVLAYPINPSAELLDLGGQAACGFEECNTTTTWGIGIYLKLERQTWGRSPPNWNSKISEVEISPVCLQCELDPSNFDTYSIPRPVKLGTW